MPPPLPAVARRHCLGSGHHWWWTMAGRLIKGFRFEKNGELSCAARGEIHVSGPSRGRCEPYPSAFCPIGRPSIALSSPSASASSPWRMNASWRHNRGSSSGRSTLFGWRRAVRASLVPCGALTESGVHRIQTAESVRRRTLDVSILIPVSPALHLAPAFALSASSVLLTSPSPPPSILCQACFGRAFLEPVV